MTQPLRLLEGVRIASFTQFLLGPAGVQYLADMGAEVVKVENPRGNWERVWSGGDAFPGGVSAFYLLSHRNTRNLTLNLKDPKAQEVAKRLVRDVDVVVENFRPGVMERFGLGYEQVCELNPSVIYASASGFGQDSPYRDLPGQDLVIQAISGLASISGRKGQPPVPTGSAIVDQHGAALLAMSVLAALFNRQRTGEGQRIDISMLQAALDLQLEPVTYWLNGGQVELPVEPLASTFHQAPYGVYQASDGYLVLSIQPIKLIREALDGAPELEPYEDPAAALSSKNEIHRALAGIICRRTVADWVEQLRARGIWCSPVNDYEHVFEDPIVVSTQPLLELDHPRAGHIRLLRFPVRFNSGEAAVRRLPPSLGEHTAEVLAELGYGAEEIREMRAAGAV
jgi:crotonobetainyl-CoA:carnitine CoA-transferase CaiB-like acyl-CoA transferase